MSSVPGPGPHIGASRLVLVTGAGRSGTSTMAGTLSRLGFHVPQPVIEANDSNPRGFYESWWPVRFHNRLMKRANTTPTDGRPSAASLMAKSVDDRARSELHSWLSEQFDANAMVMVKDPRAAWVPALWVSTAESIGVDVSFVTMLRHPAEVISSRRTHYTSDQSAAVMRTFAIRHLCGWMNQNLTLERLNRAQARSFVSYVALVSEWRPALAGMLQDLDLTPCVSTSECEAAIDAFIEPTLRRHSAGWAGFDIPDHLIGMADRTWNSLSALTASRGHDADAELALDEISQQYAGLYADAAAISWDQAESRSRTAHKKGQRQGRSEALDKQVEARRDDKIMARGRLILKRCLRRLRRK